MNLPIQIIATDFDGTVYSELEKPPIPYDLQALLAGLQSNGVIWVINTGRDLSSLLDALNQAKLSVLPDYAVTIEREIFQRDGSLFFGLDRWNRACKTAHHDLFLEVKSLIPECVDWIRVRFDAKVFEDDYSPLCVTANHRDDAAVIHEHLRDCLARVRDLAIVRNDVYIRLGHQAFNKGSALEEITRRHPGGPEAAVVAGDHLNDLPMLSRKYAHWLIAPANAIDCVKQQVRDQGGYVSKQPCGAGVMRGIEYFLEKAGAFWMLH